MSETTALEAYRRHLPPGRHLEFGIDGLDHLGMPVQTAVFFPDDATPCPGTGFGLSETAAKVGAFGELTEDLHASRALCGWPLWRGSFRQLCQVAGEDNVIHPVHLNLRAGSLWSEEDELDWARVERLAEGSHGWLPVEFLACSAADYRALNLGREPLVTPITNGLGAGLSFAHAVAHGLLEVLQRDGNGVRYRAMAQGVGIDPRTIADGEIQDILARLDGAGIDARIKLAGTDFGMANVYVVGIDRSDDAPALAIMAAACGEAVHPVARTAVRKALLEFISSRSRLAFMHGPLDLIQKVAPPEYLEWYEPFIDPTTEEPRAMTAMRHWLGKGLSDARALLSQRVLRVDNVVPETALPTADPELLADKAQLVRTLVDRLRKEDLNVWVARFTPSEDPVQVVKVIVPGLEVETMTYSRVGERNIRRLWEDRRTDLVGFGDPPAGAGRVRLAAAARKRLGGDPWFNSAAADRIVGDLYAIYREPARHALPFLIAQERHGVEQESAVP